MGQRVFLFLTGKIRCLSKVLLNFIPNLIAPNQDKEFRFFLGVDGNVEEAKLIVEPFRCYYASVHLFKCTREMDFFIKGVSAVSKYLSLLNDSWKDYLLVHSGSVLEYAQIAFLYQKAIQLFPPEPTDLLLRMRTDVILCTPWIVREPLLFLDPSYVFTNMFPENKWVKNFVFKKDREGCILPSIREENKWVVSLRKNLLYIMPYQEGRNLEKIVLNYGVWDSPKENDYWFNAESQFRGYFRKQGFTVFDLCQSKDENFEEAVNLDIFPVYAIQRKFSNELGKIEPHSPIPVEGLRKKVRYDRLRGLHPALVPSKPFYSNTVES